VAGKRRLGWFKGVIGCTIKGCRGPQTGKEADMRYFRRGFAYVTEKKEQTAGFISTAYEHLLLHFLMRALLSGNTRTFNQAVNRVHHVKRFPEKLRYGLHDIRKYRAFLKQKKKGMSGKELEKAEAFENEWTMALAAEVNEFRRHAMLPLASSPSPQRDPRSYMHYGY
jgi:hypothetical protein